MVEGVGNEEGAIAIDGDSKGLPKRAWLAALPTPGAKETAVIGELVDPAALVVGSMKVTLSRKAKAAALVPVAISAVTGVGAPW